MHSKFLLQIFCFCTGSKSAQPRKKSVQKMRESLASNRDRGSFHSSNDKKRKTAEKPINMRVKMKYDCNVGYSSGSCDLHSKVSEALKNFNYYYKIYLNTLKNVCNDKISESLLNLKNTIFYLDELYNCIEEIQSNKNVCFIENLASLNEVSSILRDLKRNIKSSILNFNSYFFKSRKKKFQKDQYMLFRTMKEIREILQKICPTITCEFLPNPNNYEQQISESNIKNIQFNDIQTKEIMQNSEISTSTEHAGIPNSNETNLSIYVSNKMIIHHTNNTKNLQKNLICQKNYILFLIREYEKNIIYRINKHVLISIFYEIEREEPYNLAKLCNYIFSYLDELKNYPKGYENPNLILLDPFDIIDQLSNFYFSFQNYFSIFTESKLTFNSNLDSLIAHENASKSSLKCFIDKFDFYLTFLEEKSHLEFGNLIREQRIIISIFRSLECNFANYLSALSFLYARKHKKLSCLYQYIVQNTLKIFNESIEIYKQGKINCNEAQKITNSIINIRESVKYSFSAINKLQHVINNFEDLFKQIKKENDKEKDTLQKLYAYILPFLKNLSSKDENNETFKYFKLIYDEIEVHSIQYLSHINTYLMDEKTNFENFLEFIKYKIGQNKQTTIDGDKLEQIQTSLNGSLSKSQDLEKSSYEYQINLDNTLEKHLKKIIVSFSSFFR
ncbi:hypothetical protein EDEG_01105 [Edhazardia aedis USNM 41457]|uniref:Uncharacterized protein n=1 Tax=Edhazardia aedis (strain USNM 41457) TaxID=1003232 RepID=J9DTR8_EDHAE|nr:hypothetical protein EDEG_01105 [Edhazardia aedis USNM 41457]|eukprot:EJW04692.1 hypothetical protein EDEG_01105 [Edhazardia aedis USNM 41457]